MSNIPETTVPQPPAERVFPPWSVEAMIAWALGSIVLSYLMGLLFGWLTAHANLHFQLGLNEGGIVFMSGHAALIAHALLVFFFILFCLKRTGFSLRDVWGSFFTTPGQLGLALFSGAALMAVVILLSKAIIEQPNYPPTDLLPLDWCFLLSMEVATNTAVIGLAEEVFFRGLLYQTLRQRAPAETAALISAILFTALHVHYLADPMRMVSVFLVGIVAALFFERTHSLSTCIAFHLSANTTVVANYYLTHFMPK